MSLHTTCLKQACEILGLGYETIGSSGVFLMVKKHQRLYPFIANRVPLNNSLVATITKDKQHTYDLLHEYVQMPLTLGYIDPEVGPHFQAYRQYDSINQIAKSITNQFQFPVIIKKNSGCQGTHVFRCHNLAEIQAALHQIYNQSNLTYDHVALAQTHLSIKREFRVTVVNRQIVLVYQKDISQATFVGNLSPLHWENAQAVIIDDHRLISRIDTFIQPIYKRLDLQYGGLDIVLDVDDTLWLLEINDHPGYNLLVESNHSQVLIDVYLKILGAL